MKQTLLLVCILALLSCSKTNTPDPGDNTNPPNTTNPSGTLIQPVLTTDNAFASYKYSTAFIKKDGSLWTFGKGEFIGRDPAVTTLTPQQVGTDKDWKSVTTGAATFAIKNDGTLWSWGEKEYVGRIGNNLIPAKVNEDKDWASVYWAPNGYTLALKKDGSLWGCGIGGFEGRVSYFLDGTTNNRPLMTRVGTDTGWQKVVVWGARIFLIKNDSSIWGWGLPDAALFGTLGTESKIVQILSTAGWVDMAARGYGAVAIKKDGTLWRWGDRIGPQQIQKIGTDTDWAKVIIENGLYTRMYALKKDGTLWVSDEGLQIPYVFKLVDTHSPGDKYEAIYTSGNGIVAKRAGKDEYCSHGLSGGYDQKYSGNILITQYGKETCASF